MEHPHYLVRFQSDHDGIMLHCRCGWKADGGPGMRDSITVYGDHRAKAELVDKGFTVSESERGSVPILDMVAAVFVALVVAFCFNMTHRPGPLQLTTVQPTTTTTTVAFPQAAPEPAQAAPTPQASAPAPAHAPDVATATVGGNEAASGEILPNPTVQLACEIIDNGPDAIASGRPADWYPITTDDATVAAAPDRFRNCTTIAAP